MANRVSLIIDILADASEANAGLDNAKKKVSGFQSGISKLTPAATIIGGGLAIIGKSAVDSASKVQQSMGSLDSVFGDNADTVKAWAKNAADSVGLSESEYGDFAAVVGAQLNNLGLDSKDAMSGTKDLISTGADLAAAFGGSTSEAVSALSSALRGEADPAERYGLSLNQATINARLAEKGMDKLTGTQLTAAKAATVLELAQEQAGGAAGQFARETDTLAGQQQRMAAQTENAKAALGEALLPAVTAVTSGLKDMAGFVQENTTLFLVIAGVLAAFAGTVLALNAAMKIYRATTAAVTAATKAWAVATRVAKAAMTALSANPIMLIVIAVVALVAGIVLLWNKCEGFRNAVLAIWNAIKVGAEAAWNVIKAVISVVISWAMKYIKAYMAIALAVWRTIMSVAKAVWNAIKAAINVVIKAITLYIKVYLTVVRTVFNGVKAIATSVWNGIKAVIRAVINVITAYIKTYLAVVRAVFTAIKTVASTAWNGVLAIIRGITDRIKGIVRTIKEVVIGVWDSIKSATSRIWDSIAGAIKRALSPIRGLIDGIKSAFQGVIDIVERVIGAIKRIKIPKIPGLSKLLGSTQSASAAPPVPQAAVRGRLGAPAPLVSSGGGNGVTINITGALDPVSVARQVRHILRDDDRRRRGVLIGRTA